MLGYWCLFLCTDRNPQETHMESVRMSFPLPPKEIHPNARGKNWRAKARYIAKRRKEVGELAFLQLRQIGWMTRPQWKCAAVTIYAYLPTAHRHDQDNLLAWMKSTIDGLTDAGLFDDDKEIAYMPSIQNTDRDNPRLEIEAHHGRIKAIKLTLETPSKHAAGNQRKRQNHAYEITAAASETDTEVCTASSDLGNTCPGTSSNSSSANRNRSQDTAGKQADRNLDRSNAAGKHAKPRAKRGKAG